MGSSVGIPLGFKKPNHAATRYDRYSAENAREQNVFNTDKRRGATAIPSVATPGEACLSGGPWLASQRCSWFPRFDLPAFICGSNIRKSRGISWISMWLRPGARSEKRIKRIFSHEKAQKTQESEIFCLLRFFVVKALAVTRTDHETLRSRDSGERWPFSPHLRLKCQKIGGKIGESPRFRRSCAREWARSEKKEVKNDSGLTPNGQFWLNFVAVRFTSQGIA
jgi:hypothetical protein